MDIIHFAIQNLTEENKAYIKNRKLKDLSDHFGVSMLIRNIIYKFSNDFSFISPENLNLEFPTIDAFESGEICENFLLEKLWRIFNNIEFNDNDKQELKNIIGNSNTLFLDKNVRKKMIKYINGLKK
ncbi:MAG: hypothetical protein K1X55_06570 [Chitinophagales bacterium]|nr:hypothetical protein [Chitinophagales bacterium]